MYKVSNVLNTFLKSVKTLKHFFEKCFQRKNKALDQLNIWSIENIPMHMCINVPSTNGYQSYIISTIERKQSLA